MMVAVGNWRSRFLGQQLKKRSLNLEITSWSLCFLIGTLGIEYQFWFLKLNKFGWYFGFSFLAG